MSKNGGPAEGWHVRINAYSSDALGYALGAFKDVEEASNGCIVSVSLEGHEWSLIATWTEPESEEAKP